MREMTAYPFDPRDATHQSASETAPNTSPEPPADASSTYAPTSAAPGQAGGYPPAPGSPRPARRHVGAEIGRLVAALLIGAIIGTSVSVASGRSAITLPKVTTPIGAIGTSAPAANTAEIAAIKDVIQRADAEQAQAIARNDPTLMKDTATAAHYQELVKVNGDLASAGVTNIRLLGISWGTISVSRSTARAVSYETWRSTFQNGTVDQSRDENDYSLVLQNGKWVVSADDQPGASQSSSGQPPNGVVPPNGLIPPTTARDTSSNWSGYDATGGTFTAVSASWKVPDPKMSTVGADATWVGIGGVSSHDLIQAGTEATVPDSSTVSFNAWIETLPSTQTIVPLTISPGDTVTVSITNQSGDQWKISLKDDTTGKSYETTVTYSSTLSSAEWVEEAPSGGRRILPLDDFGTVHLTNAHATKDGRSITISAANGQPVTMINGFRQALAEPSQLGQDGASFTITRTSASATAPVGPYFHYGRGGG